MTGRFDRSRLLFHPLGERPNRVHADDLLREAKPKPEALRLAGPIAKTFAEARRRGAARILVFGAHTIKNGMGPLIAELMRSGWITHCATNGAGIIHDWELAYQGATSEHVQENVAIGRFGMWEETLRNLNLAIDVGAYRGWGYGESIGRLVDESGFTIPDSDELAEARRTGDPELAAAASDLEAVVERLKLTPGYEAITHRFPHLGLQSAAIRSGVPYTAHPMFGHDIIYAHPACCGAAIGRTADRDFLSYAFAVNNLEGGVYLSVGSAVMSPMIFEKSLSMARNCARQSGAVIENFDIFAVDLAESTWDWQRDGEPPPSNPAYYVRFCKSFSRMGGRFHYMCLDATELYPALIELLRS